MKTTELLRVLVSLRIETPLKERLIIKESLGEFRLELYLICCKVAFYSEEVWTDSAIKQINLLIQSETKCIVNSTMLV